MPGSPAVVRRVAGWQRMRGAEQRLGQREHGVLQGRDARDDVGGGGLDGLAPPSPPCSRAGASSLPSIARTRSYWSSSRSSSRSSRAVSLLSSAPRVAARPSMVAARPSTVAAIPVALASSMASSRSRISCSALATDRLLDEVIVHRAREQFAHPVGGGVLPVVSGRGRTGWRATAGGCCPAGPSCSFVRSGMMECDHFSSSSWSCVHKLLNREAERRARAAVRGASPRRVDAVDGGG